MDVNNVGFDTVIVLLDNGMVVLVNEDILWDGFDEGEVISVVWRSTFTIYI